VHDLSPVMRENDENEQHAKRGSWDGEKINRCEFADMVVQKRSPRLGGKLRSSWHPSRDSPLGDVDSQLQEFPVYVWSAPQRIRIRHPPDQLPDLAVFARTPSAAMSGTASPAGGESPSMPSKNGFRLNDEECLFPAFPRSRQDDPKEAIESPKPGPWMSSVQDGELLAKGEVLESQF
jgi:hypothetical protein